MLSNPHRSAIRSGLLTLALAFGFGAVGALTPIAHADPASPTVISIHVGETAAINQTGLSKMAVGDPSIADVHPTGDDTAEVIGRSEGKTTLLVWDRADHRTAYVIDVEK